MLASGLTRFDQCLRESGSATAVLAQWMAERSGRVTVSITARRVAGHLSAPETALMERLRVRDEQELAYRRVRLMDGRHVLSDAHNWYVPARLPEGMRALLDETDMPFGAVIAPLAPTRQTLNVEHYWPTPGMPPSSGERLPARLLRHDALVRSASGEPLCEVSEIYTRNILL